MILEVGVRGHIEFAAAQSGTTKPGHLGKDVTVSCLQPAYPGTARRHAMMIRSLAFAFTIPDLSAKPGTPANPP